MHQLHNNVSVKDRPLVQQWGDGAEKLLLPSNNDCNAAAHSSCICGEAGANKPTAWPVYKSIAHKITVEGYTL